MSVPKVSIVLPTYNREDTLGVSVSSLLNQSYDDFEIIISDDGSTDGTESLIHNFNDSRIRYIKSERRKGANHARNMGIKESLGEYIAFQDSDDSWHSDKLQKQMEALQKGGEGGNICFCGMIRNINNKAVYIPKKKKRIEAGLVNLHSELLKGNFIGTPTLVAKKNILYDIGLFDEALSKLQDWDLVLRLSKSNGIIYVNEPLLRADVNDSSITTNIPSCSAIENILRKHHSDFKDYPKALLIQYINIIVSSAKSTQLGISLTYLLRALFLLLKKPHILFQ